MELALRCELRDRPGMLATLAGAIGRAGGDIQAINVVEADDGRVLDDLLVVVDSARLSELMDGMQSLDEVTIIHAGPSRGHPGDAVTRLALGLETLLTGATAHDRGLTTVIGGLLRASSAELVEQAARPRREDGRVLTLPVDDRVLVLRRDYRFTRTEREQAEAVLRLCLLTLGGRTAPAGR